MEPSWNILKSFGPWVMWVVPSRGLGDSPAATTWVLPHRSSTEPSHGMVRVAQQGLFSTFPMEKWPQNSWFQSGSTRFRTTGCWVHAVWPPSPRQTTFPLSKQRTSRRFIFIFSVELNAQKTLFKYKQQSEIATWHMYQANREAPVLSRTPPASSGVRRDPLVPFQDLWGLALECPPILMEQMEDGWTF